MQRPVREPYQRHHLAHFQASAQEAANSLRKIDFHVERVPSATTRDRQLAAAIGDRLPESLPPAIRDIVGDAIVDLLVAF